MKAILALFALVIVSASAQAEIFTCHFTEPFVTVKYTTGTQTLSYQDFGADQKKPKLSAASFLIRDAGVFEVRQNGKVVMTLTLDKKGSDGASEDVYPYSVDYVSMRGYANGGQGGCESLAIKTVKNTQD
jgi:uncharacterized membrane protein